MARFTGMRTSEDAILKLGSLELVDRTLINHPSLFKESTFTDFIHSQTERPREIRGVH